MSSDEVRPRRQLESVLALATRPGTEGEHEAAAQAAVRLLLRHPWLIATANSAAARPGHTPKPSRGWREALRRCAAQPQRLTDWERGFVVSLSHRKSLSTKQAAALHRIAGCCGCNWSYP
jgi:hypothetical protein